MKTLLPFIIIIFLIPSFLYAQNDQQSLIEKQKEIIRYGTEVEIANLITSLEKQQNIELDEDLLQELISVEKKSKNKNVLSSIFNFMGKLKKSGLEQRALMIIQEYYDEQQEVILGALTYLEKVPYTAAIEPLNKILQESDDKTILLSTVNTIGSIGALLDLNEKEKLSQYLLTYYKEKDPSEDIKNAIIKSLGNLGALETIDFLIDIVIDENIKSVPRMRALESLAKLVKISEDSYQKKKVEDAFIIALQSKDSNVRATAIGCLGSFSDEQTEQAILDAFRDSFYKTRIGAAKAAEERKLTKAIPYLRFRAQYDEVLAVKEASIHALGVIATEEAQSVLLELFSTKKNPDTVRILSAEQLVSINASQYVPQIILALEEAQKNKQKNLYNGLARILSTAQTEKVHDLAVRFLQSNDPVEKLYGLQMVENNKFTDLVEQVRSLTDEKQGTITTRAKSTLTKLGF